MLDVSGTSAPLAYLSPSVAQVCRWSRVTVSVVVRNRAFLAGKTRQARLKIGLSRTELARAVGVSAATIKAWETGRRTPQPTVLHSLAHTLRVPVESLLNPRVQVDDLARMRESSGLTLTGAAERLGLAMHVLKAVERGKRLPPDPTAMRRLYRVTSAELAQAARNTTSRR